MYRLDSSVIGRNQNISVVGCGGTGGFVAEGLCRMLPPSMRILLIDCDRVEDRNLARSNYTGSDIDQFKSEALAERLSARYGRAIAYSTLPVGFVELPFGLVIGCVDNGPARLAISKTLPNGNWWIDSGNGRDYGQVLIGSNKRGNSEPCFSDGICWWLPLPTVQRPELLAQEPRRRSCDEAVDRNEQSPTINLAMAALVLEVVKRLISGTCSWLQLYLDLEAGTLYPVIASPESVARIMGTKINKLILKKGGEQ